MGATGWGRVDAALARLQATGPGGRALRDPRVHRVLSLGNAGLRRARNGGRLAIPRHRAVVAANPASPTLGVAMLAQNSAHLLPGALSPALLAAVDEVVVLDGGSTDGTSDVARGLGARVVDAPWPGDFGAAFTAAAHSVRCDWMMILDTDEVVSDRLLDALPHLIRSRRSGWWLPRRWVVPLGGDRLGFIAGRPHWPDHVTRLARRTPDLHYRGAVHTSLAADVAGVWGVAPKRTPILHLDLLLNDRATREAKVAGRRETPGFRGTESFYLWEDHPRRIAPLGPDEGTVRAALARMGVGDSP